MAKTIEKSAKDQKLAVKDGDVYIVKFIEWHAYIGRVEVGDTVVRLTYPKYLRDWGATKGLGELYAGPLKNTILDLSGALTIPLSSIICFMEVDQKAWKDKIAKSEHGGD